jgi:hypothetical protein
LVGVTLTIPLQDVVVSVNAVVAFWDTETLCAAAPVPTPRNERELGERLIEALPDAVGAGVALAIAVGPVVGPIVGTVVGDAGMAPTAGEGLDDPPPPQAARNTATTPADTKNERNLWPLREPQHTRVCLISHPYDGAGRTPPTWAFRPIATGGCAGSQGERPLAEANSRRRSSWLR